LPFALRKGSAFRAETAPSYNCFPPREGCAFTRPKTGYVKINVIGKAQPFPSTEGRSRRSHPIAGIAIWTSPAHEPPLRSFLLPFPLPLAANPSRPPPAARIFRLTSAPLCDSLLLWSSGKSIRWGKRGSATGRAARKLAPADLRRAVAESGKQLWEAERRCLI